jgi:hypothetical protein
MQRMQLDLIPGFLGPRQRALAAVGSLVVTTPTQKGNAAAAGHELLKRSCYILGMEMPAPRTLSAAISRVGCVFLGARLRAPAAVGRLVVHILQLRKAMQQPQTRIVKVELLYTRYGNASSTLSAAISRVGCVFLPSCPHVAP